MTTSTTDNRQYDEDKFKNLILYIADQMRDADTYGATMLNKVLFYSDFFHYAEHGVAITGADYQRLDYGPAPKKLVPARDALLAEKKAAVRITTLGPRTQKRLEALVDPDLSKFTATEIKQVDEVIELLRGHTAGQVSNATHSMICWKVADNMETIPYETVFLTKTAITDSDRETARTLKQSLAAA